MYGNLIRCVLHELGGKMEQNEKIVGEAEKVIGLDAYGRVSFFKQHVRLDDGALKSLLRVEKRAIGGNGCLQYKCY